MIKSVVGSVWLQDGTTIASLKLTHICLVDFSILINWTSPFPILGVSVFFFQFYSISNRYSCTEDPDQTPHSAASDLGLHCLPMSPKWDARLIWVKYLSCCISYVQVNAASCQSKFADHFRILTESINNNNNNNKKNRYNPRFIYCRGHVT